MRRVLLAIVAAASVSATASAQTVFEGAVGYNIVDYHRMDGTPVGWFGSFAAKPVHWFAIVSELTTEFQTDNTPGRPAQSKSAFAFVDGPRFMAPIRSRATVFGELLVGVAHDGEFFPDRSDANRFVWQPGAGLDIGLSDRLSVRFQATKRFACCSLNSPFAFGFLTGIVVSGTRSTDSLKLLVVRQQKAERSFKTAYDAKAKEDANVQKATDALAQAESVLSMAQATLKADTDNAGARASAIMQAQKTVDADQADLKQKQSDVKASHDKRSAAGGGGKNPVTAAERKQLDDAVLMAETALKASQQRLATDRAQLTQLIDADRALLRNDEDDVSRKSAAVEDHRAALDIAKSRLNQAEALLDLARSGLENATAAIDSARQEIGTVP